MGHRTLAEIAPQHIPRTCMRQYTLNMLPSKTLSTVASTQLDQKVCCQHEGLLGPFAANRSHSTGLAGHMPICAQLILSDGSLLYRNRHYTFMLHALTFRLCYVPSYQTSHMLALLDFLKSTIYIHMHVHEQMNVTAISTVQWAMM